GRCSGWGGGRFGGGRCRGRFGGGRCSGRVRSRLGLPRWPLGRRRGRFGLRWRSGWNGCGWIGGRLCAGDVDCGDRQQRRGRKNLQREGCRKELTFHRANNSFIPPAIKTDTSTNTRGREIPPRATRYFASHTGSNFAL